MSAKPAYYLSFRVGKEWYGISVGAVIEVLHLVTLTDLPASPPHVLGLLTLRDMFMPVVDLRLRFDLVSHSLRLDTHLIAAHTPSGPVAVVVDEVNGVEQITATSDSSAHDSPYVLGVARLADHLMLLLDLTHLYP